MRKQKKDAITKLIPLLSICISCAVALLGWVAWLARNVAQTSEVEIIAAKQFKYTDLKVAEAVKYMDDKLISFKKEAYDHTDLGLANAQAEYKSLASKMDMLIMLQTQQQGGNRK